MHYLFARCVLQRLMAHIEILLIIFVLYEHHHSLFGTSRWFDRSQRRDFQRTRLNLKLAFTASGPHFSSTRILKWSLFTFSTIIQQHSWRMNSKYASKIVVKLFQEFSQNKNKRGRLCLARCCFLVLRHVKVWWLRWGTSTREYASSLGRRGHLVPAIDLIAKEISCATIRVLFRYKDRFPDKGMPIMKLMRPWGILILKRPQGSRTSPMYYRALLLLLETSHTIPLLIRIVFIFPQNDNFQIWKYITLHVLPFPVDIIIFWFHNDFVIVILSLEKVNLLVSPIPFMI